MIADLFPPARIVLLQAVDDLVSSVVDRKRTALREFVTDLLNPGPEMWYDRSAFPLVPGGAYLFGTSGRNILDGPGLVDFNASLMKRFVVRERYTVQFRCEAFNVLNRPNFNLPNPNVNAPTGGTITDTRAPRLIQFGLRLRF